MRARSTAEPADGLIFELPTLTMTITAISDNIKSIVKTKYAINTRVFFQEQAPRTRIVVIYTPRTIFAIEAVLAADRTAVIIPAIILKK